MFHKQYPWILIASLIVLAPLQSCYLFCLFKADPILEQTVEHLIENGMMGGHSLENE